jgi:Ni/Co efflux regulator RcnB
MKNSYYNLLHRINVMQRFIFQMRFILALVFAGIWSTGTAFADKPGWAGDKKRVNYSGQETRENHRGEEKRKTHSDDRTPVHGSYDERSRNGDQKSGYFSEHKKKFVRQYYSDQFRKGHCPPGLLKKGNGCLPPGHAKMWKKGQPLPREVIFHDLPPSILGQLGPPPPMHRFVRVAQDILLISSGTGMVLDAFENIGWLD